MKKIISLVLVMIMVLALAACKPAAPTDPTTEPTKPTEPAVAPTKPTEPTVTPTEPDADVLSYAEYVAAEDGTIVTVEFYVQATQSWWDNKISIYGQTEEGGYYSYETVCSQEDAAKLVPGTLIRVTGEKSTWQGEIEIMAGTIEFVDAEPWIAEPTDVTALLGQDAIAEHMNKLCAFKGMTVVAINYRNGEPGDDIYVTLAKNGVNHEFCVERYLTGPETEVYKAFAELKAGDTVDVEGFLYYYADAINPHITAIAAAKSAHDLFVEAEDGTIVTVEFYVQATQSWWDNKITIYGQTPEGGYFSYETACSQEDAAKLVPGTLIRITGEKTTWQGEIEIMAGTIEFLEGNTWIAEATDVTALLGKEEIAVHMNKLCAFKGMTVVAINYRNGEPGDDIYVTLAKDGVNYEFCVERYLTDPSTDVYKAFAELKAGDVVDVEGFLYYYADAINPHIISVKSAG